MKLAEITKTLITALGLIVSVGTLVLQNATGFLPAGWAGVVSTVVGVATIALNYLVPNTTTDPERAVGRSVVLKSNKHEAG